MKIENKKTEEEVLDEEETSEEQEESTVEEESEDEASSSQKEDKPAEPEIDYKAELEKVQKRLTKAEFKLYKKSQEEKGTHTEDDEHDDDYTPATTSKEDIQKILEQEREAYRLTLAQDAVELELERFSDNPDRQALIKYHYENTINRSGYSRADIKHDLELAEFLADKAKFQTRIDEVNKSIKAQKSAQKGGIAAGVASGDKPKVTLSEKEKALLQRHGLSEKDITNS
jgi:hypothetical protein